MGKAGVVSPSSNRADWARAKASAAIWTNVVQKLVDASGTKRTFIGADAGVIRVGSKVHVTPFAIWSEFQHGNFLSPEIGRVVWAD